ncbi:hypothetical protein BDC45DRAFT_566634 [Circinella umbellata]|nr:hypothetical protein BDC45DRAFT_566634 [Circinella umbellata]
MAMSGRLEDNQLEGKRYSFHRFDNDDYLGDMATTDDQLEGKRYSFHRFDDDDYLGDMATTGIFIGRSTGGQAIQFSLIRQRLLPW